MRTLPTSTRTARSAAALALAGTGAALLLAAPALAAPAALPAAPQVLAPIDTRDGLLGVPRGGVPPLGTPDLTGVPGAEQLPGMEVAPLPTTGATSQDGSTPE